MERHGGSKTEGLAFTSPVDKRNNCIHRLHLPWLEHFTTNNMLNPLNMVKKSQKQESVNSEPSQMKCRMDALQ